MTDRQTTAPFPETVGTTVSSLAPRRRLKYHQEQIRSIQHLILEHEADIRSLYNQLHNHLSRVQVLLGATVCLTAYEHERLVDRAGGGGTAGPRADSGASAGAGGGGSRRAHRHEWSDGEPSDSE